MTLPERDSFRSPSQPGLEFTVLPTESNFHEQDFEGADKIIVLSSQGTETHSPEKVMLDRLRLNPRLGDQALSEIVESANFRWALDETQAKDAPNA